MKKHHGDERRIAELNGNACRGKLRYPSKVHALSAGRRMIANGYERARHMMLNAYKCHCGAWYLGNSPHWLIHDRRSIVRRATDATLLERQLAAVLAHVIAEGA